jgi:ABC-type sugar transport system permease subunit
MTPHRHSRSPVFAQNIWGILFILPAIGLLLIFNIYPLLRALYLSFHTWSLAGKPAWVGLANYVRMFTQDQQFTQAMGVTIRYSLGVNPVLWVSGLSLALLMNRDLKGRSIFRTIYFIPTVVSWVVVSIVWYSILHPSFGINAMIMRVLFNAQGIPFLTHQAYALPMIIALSVWKSMGYQMVIFLAGLQAIPGVFYEAAAIDGANRWQQFIHITLPLLAPTILFVMVTSIIGSFQVFTPIQILTLGGPAGATRVLPYLIYQNAFLFLKMGYASAMSVVLFMILMTLTLIQVRVFRMGEIG